MFSSFQRQEREKEKKYNKRLKMPCLPSAYVFVSLSHSFLSVLQETGVCGNTCQGEVKERKGGEKNKPEAKKKRWLLRRWVTARQS
jgi:hypothetical protein